MANMVSKINKSEVSVDGVEGKRVMHIHPCELFPKGTEIFEDVNHTLIEHEDYWEVKMGPMPLLCLYDKWEDVPEDERWWWDDNDAQVERIAGPPAMRSLYE